VGWAGGRRRLKPSGSGNEAPSGLGASHKPVGLRYQSPPVHRRAGVVRAAPPPWKGGGGVGRGPPEAKVLRLR